MKIKPRVCTVCRHIQRQEIDKALVARRAFRDIAGQYKVSKSALVRHHDDHLPAALVKAKEAPEAAQADALLTQVVDLRDKALVPLAAESKYPRLPGLGRLLAAMSQKDRHGLSKEGILVRRCEH